jgi:hypothetical protein
MLGRVKNLKKPADELGSSVLVEPGRFSSIRPQGESCTGPFHHHRDTIPEDSQIGNIGVVLISQVSISLALRALRPASLY